MPACWMILVTTPSAAEEAFNSALPRPLTATGPHAATKSTQLCPFVWSKTFSPCPPSPVLPCWQHSATLPFVVIPRGLKHPQSQVTADALLCFDDDLVEMVR